MNFEHQDSFIFLIIQIQVNEQKSRKKEVSWIHGLNQFFLSTFALVFSRLALFKELFLYKMVIVAIAILDCRNNFLKGQDSAMEHTHKKGLPWMFLLMICVSTKEHVSIVFGTPFYAPILMLDTNWHLYHRIL